MRSKSTPNLNLKTNRINDPYPTRSLRKHKQAADKNIKEEPEEESKALIRSQTQVNSPTAQPVGSRNLQTSATFAVAGPSRLAALQRRDLNIDRPLPRPSPSRSFTQPALTPTASRLEAPKTLNTDGSSKKTVTTKPASVTPYGKEAILTRSYTDNWKAGHQISPAPDTGSASVPNLFKNHGKSVSFLTPIKDYGNKPRAPEASKEKNKAIPLSAVKGNKNKSSVSTLIEQEKSPSKRIVTSLSPEYSKLRENNQPDVSHPMYKRDIQPVITFEEPHVVRGKPNPHFRSISGRAPIFVKDPRNVIPQTRTQYHCLAGMVAASRQKFYPEIDEDPVPPMPQHPAKIANGWSKWAQSVGLKEVKPTDPSWSKIPVGNLQDKEPQTRGRPLPKPNPISVAAAIVRRTKTMPVAFKPQRFETDEYDEDSEYSEESDESDHDKRKANKTTEVKIKQESPDIFRFGPAAPKAKNNHAATPAPSQFPQWSPAGQPFFTPPLDIPFYPPIQGFPQTSKLSKNGEGSGYIHFQKCPSQTPEEPFMNSAELAHPNDPNEMNWAKTFPANPSAGDWKSWQK